MKRIDRLILKELVGPWLFGVGLFTSLIMAATYLGRLAGFIADGVSPRLVYELVALYMPAILVKTFSMAVLLAGLLGFGRLSSDSEIVALRAGGASVYRIVAPVIGFSIAVTALTFFFDEKVMPAATVTSKRITEEVAHSMHPKAAMPIAKTIVSKEKLQAGVIAANVNPATQALEGVTMVAYDPNGNVSFLMFAKEIDVTGGLTLNNTSWSIKGGAELVSADLKTVLHFQNAWPSVIPRPSQPFQQLLAEGPEDFDSQSMAQLKTAIAYHLAEGDETLSQIHNLEYGYWNKIAVPLAAIMFGALGAVLGIRNHRTGTATGMALAIGIIFGFVTLGNFMNVWAQNGVFPAWVASFVPLAIGGLASGVIMWRRN